MFEFPNGRFDFLWRNTISSPIDFFIEIFCPFSTDTGGYRSQFPSGFTEIRKFTWPWKHWASVGVRDEEEKHVWRQAELTRWVVKNGGAWKQPSIIVRRTVSSLVFRARAAEIRAVRSRIKKFLWTKNLPLAGEGVPAQTGLSFMLARNELPIFYFILESTLQTSFMK